MIRGVADAVLALLLAPGCAVCRDPLERPTQSAVCSCCWSAVRLLRPPLCAGCGDPMPSVSHSGEEPSRCPACRATPGLITRVRAAAEYEGRMRDILHALKYEGRRSLGAEVAALMQRQGTDVLCGADCVVPVPLHWRRRWRRGFNQSRDLARGLGLPVRDLLRRRRHTAAQADLPAPARRINVQDAFRARRRADVSGLRVVLVDDVSTTGATLEACARALLAAGAGEVRALTAARVVTAPRRARAL